MIHSFVRQKSILRGILWNTQEMVSSEVRNLFCSIWKVVNPRNCATDISHTLIFRIISNRNHPNTHSFWPEYMANQRRPSALVLCEVINLKNRCKYLRQNSKSKAIKVKGEIGKRLRNELTYLFPQLLSYHPQFRTGLALYERNYLRWHQTNKIICLKERGRKQFLLDFHTPTKSIEQFTKLHPALFSIVWHS